MKPKSLSILIAASVLASGAWAQTPVGINEPVYDNTTKIPLAITTADSVETPIGTLEFFDGVPVGDTTQKVYDYVDRARAVEVFINLIPAVSVYHLRQGMRDMGLTESNQIVLAEQLGDSKPLVLTWNNTSLYTWGFLDLAKDGPTVVEVPAPRDFLWAALVCGLAYGGIVLGGAIAGGNLGNLLGTIAAVAAANIWAGATRRPTSIALLPAIVLLVSGSIGFRGLAAIAAGQTSTGEEQFLQMFVVALTIGAGLLVGNTIVRPKATL